MNAVLINGQLLKSVWWSRRNGSGTEKLMTGERKEALRGHAAMLLFASLISISFTLGDLAVPHLAPGPMTAARFLLAVAVMGTLVVGQIRAEHFRAPWRYPLLGGLMGGYFILMFEALAITDPVSTGAVFTLTPMMGAVFGYLLLRQSTTPVMALSLALAALGSIWVIFRADIDAILGMRIGPGERLFFIGCMAHALYIPLVPFTKRGEPTLVYSFGALVGGLLVTSIYSAREIVAIDWAGLPMIAWACVIYLGIFTTAGTFFLVQYASLRLPAAKVIAYGYLVPSFVIFQQGILGHGWVAGPVWLGAAATIAALLILLRDQKPAARP